MFLTMWDYMRGEERLRRLPPGFPSGRVRRLRRLLRPTLHRQPPGRGAVGETVYLNLINKAKKYVYLTTPYLIVSDSVNTALCSAAKAGVDVRIITPHIPDKKVILR